MFIKAGPIPSNIIVSEAWANSGKFNNIKSASKTETAPLPKPSEVTKASASSIKSEAMRIRATLTNEPGPNNDIDTLGTIGYFGKGKCK